jgi:hypothetical protein
MLMKDEVLLGGCRAPKLLRGYVVLIGLSKHLGAQHHLHLGYIWGGAVNRLSS